MVGCRGMVGVSSVLSSGCGAYQRAGASVCVRSNWMNDDDVGCSRLMCI